MTDDDIAALDAADPLGRFRRRFRLPDGIVYLDGNSLGPLPVATPGRVAEVVEREWGDGLIGSWNAAGWIDLPARVGARIAGLIGARPEEVVAADSTSVNLFKLLAAALALRPDRKVILSEEGNFPTDLYVAQGLRDLLDDGLALRLVGPDDLVAAMDADVAVVLATQVDYRSGRMHDMARVTRAAHDAGALMLWDLAHSAGAFPVDLNGCRADLAVGCGYKYLNGGPGAPAFLFVAERLQDDIRPPLSGWMGHASPFDFDAAYRPAGGIRRNLCGTPQILGLAALEAGLETFDGVDMAEVRAKSVALCEMFIGLVEERCAGFGFRLASPRDAARRGSQVCFANADGYAVIQALIARGVIGDFRAPDILRFGFAPLYLSYRDVADAVDALDRVIVGQEWKRPEFSERNAVT